MNAELRAVVQTFYVAKHNFRYCTDRDRFGKEEYWIGADEIKQQLNDYGVLVGDCDDFSSMCVMLLRKQNIPARFVFCKTENGEGHLVAEVDGWILDNRESEVARRDDLDYEWLFISGYNPGDSWQSILA